MIYFIEANITNNANKNQILFYESCKEILKNIIIDKYISLSTILELRGLELKKEDTVIFFNREDDLYEEQFSNFLKKGLKKGTKLYPVALNEKSRTSPSEISAIQSFDIAYEIKSRKLSENDIEIVGSIFARKIIVDNASTIYNSKQRYFISHRRVDGEDIAYNFVEALNPTLEKCFIDLAEVSSGEDAQKIIEEELPKSDILILLQTPKVKESKYILKEIKIALREDIPILWVLIGSADPKDLKIQPIGVPHFKIKDEDLENGNISNKTVNKIINFGFEMIKCQKRKILDNIFDLRDKLENEGYEFTIIDKKNFIYKTNKKSEKKFYNHRDLCYLVECFGREIQNEDIKSLKETLKKCNLFTGISLKNHFDSAILASTKVKKLYNVEEDFYCDNYDGIIKKICNSKKELNEKSPLEGIVISGAFPDYLDSKLQQNLIDSIYTLVEEIHKNKGTVIFGSHPTFQGLILEKGRKDRPNDYVNGTRLYVSKWFEGKYELDYFKENSIVIETDKKLTIGDSLTEMRIQMIKDENAKALICLGGQFKTEDKPNPGIDEEIKIAKEQNLEVFLIGSVGGRSNQIRSEIDSKQFENLNTLSKGNQIEIFSSLNYKKSFNTIIKHLKGEQIK